MFSWNGPAAETATDIASQATDTADFLVKAASKISGYEALCTPEELAKYREDIKSTQTLVQKIRYQQDLQTPPVATALATLKVVAEKLARVAGAGSRSSQKLSDVMEELCLASKNLKQQLPGDFYLANNNEVQKGFQFNAAIGGNRAEGRLVSEAEGNKSTDAAQVNAPIFGDLLAVAELMKVMQAGTRA